MSNPTPGPWTAWEWSVTGPTAAAAMVAERSLQGEFKVPTTRVCQTKNAGKKVIALVFGGSQEEADATAKLAAAAPDLLEALRLHDTGCLVMDPEPDCDCYGCRTRAAIAKAGGVS